ncbi:MAG: c-type cytochrome [Bacteroidota bacterium]
MNRSMIWLLLTLSLVACNSQQEEGENNLTEEFLLQDGFAIECVAQEPLLEAPVAMSFDLRGRIWVVELPGYMRNIDGEQEELPDGKIVILEDSDRDGRMDRRKVFLDSLVTPRALALAYGGLLYTEKTNLWWTSIDGDRPGEKTLVDSLYVVGGNIEHQPNGLLYNLNNWIYSAKSNARYRKKGDRWLKETTFFRGQWGISQDDEGRLYYNDNSNPLFGDLLPPNQLINHPYQAVQFGANYPVATDRRMHLYQATAVNRGYIPGVLDSTGRVKHFTSACGPLIYRGQQLGEAYYGDAFVCGPEGNLVKHYQLQSEQARTQATPGLENTEFLCSKDETFRPVNLYTGPDGALYVLDLRKGVIQHRAYMTGYLRDLILEKGLDKVVQKGRIYKVYAKGHPADPLPDFSSYQTNDWIRLLQHPNGALRSLAQQQLVSAGNREQQSALEDIALDHSVPLGQIQALWTLAGLDILRPAFLQRLASNKPTATQMGQILCLLPKVEMSAADRSAIVQQAYDLGSPKLDLQLCHTASWLASEPSAGFEEIAGAIWKKLADKYANDPLYCEALLSGIQEQESKFTAYTRQQHPADSLQKQLAVVVANRRNDDFKAPRFIQRTFLDHRTNGLQLYSVFCASCHGLDGKGNARLAPSIDQSEYTNGSSEQLIALALNGLQGPITVKGKKYDSNLVMPGIRNNPALDDAALFDLLVFVRNAFSNTWKPMSPKMIANIRAATADQTEMFTEESLKKWTADYQAQQEKKKKSLSKK